MKKIFAIILAIFMIASVSIIGTSAAGAAAHDPDAKVSFTLACSKPGYEFTVYRLATVATGSNPYEIKYNSTMQTMRSVIAGGDSQAILAAADQVTFTSNSDKIIGKYSVDTDGATKTFSDLDQGIFYVRATNYPAGAESVTNSVFALPYYTEANGWVYSLSDAIPLATKIEDGTPTIEKTIANSTKGNVNYTDVSLGDTVEFEIKTSVVGSSSMKLNSYTIYDTMSAGLTWNYNSIAVKLADNDGTVLSTLSRDDITVNTLSGGEEGEGRSFKVGLKKAYLQGEDFYNAKYVILSYTAVLNKYAVTGAAGNPNEAVKLEYSNKNDVVAEVPGNPVYVYTYTVQVNKTDENGAALADAEFELYSTQADAEAGTNPIASATSGADGIAQFLDADGNEVRLASGTYYIKETAAPTGYNKYTDVIPVEITAVYGTALVNNTYVTSAPTTDNASVNGVKAVSVKNSKVVLPQTGGAGNVIIYAVALTLAAAGGIILFISRKKKHSADDKAA